MYPVWTGRVANPDTLVDAGKILLILVSW